MYFLKGALLLTSRGITAERPAAVHLSVLGSLLFLVLAFNTFVGMHAVLYLDAGARRRRDLHRRPRAPAR